MRFAPKTRGGLSTTKLEIMKTFDVLGKVRENVGKKDSKKLRSENKVPCVLYGTENPIHFYCDFSEIRKLIYTPHVYLVNLDIDGDKHQAIMQDVQFQGLNFSCKCAV